MNLFELKKAYGEPVHVYVRLWALTIFVCGAPAIPPLLEPIPEEVPANVCGRCLEVIDELIETARQEST